MIVSVPASAPAGPPVTGASSMRIFFAPSVAAIRWVAWGAIVLMSMTVVPGLAAAITPLSPSSTCSTSAVAVTTVMTIWDREASSRGLPASDAPAVTSGVAASGRLA